MRFPITLFVMVQVCVIAACSVPSTNTVQGQQATRSIEIGLAKKYFADAESMLKLDGAKLWGKSLAGPIMFVDPDSRLVITNQFDKNRKLEPVDGVFSGRLEPEVMIANTAIDWNGTKWAMVMWPLPDNQEDRNVLLAHESWHRIQNDLGFESSGASNDHLDTLEGRFLLQLEWRALAKALSSNGEEQITAISDALHFRKHRHELFDNSNAQEQSMELHEGLAEYTGVKIAMARKSQVIRAIDKLESRPKQLKTFVRSFAYLSGPAYGLLLDDLDEGWNKKLTSESDLGDLLGKACRIELATNLNERVETSGEKYAGTGLWANEKAKDDKRKAIAEEYSSRLVTGNRLVIPLIKMNMSFNPNELIPLGEHGTVYPTLTISDEWGVLKVTDGGLISKDFKTVVVALPKDYAGSSETEGWKIDLHAGWEIRIAENKSFHVIQPDRLDQK